MHQGTAAKRPQRLLLHFCATGSLLRHIAAANPKPQSLTTCERLLRPSDAFMRKDTIQIQIPKTQFKRHR